MFVIVQLNGEEVLNPTLIGVNPSNIKVIGSFDSVEIANQWLQEMLLPIHGNEENFVILPIEWYSQTTY